MRHLVEQNRLVARSAVHRTDRDLLAGAVVDHTAPVAYLDIVVGGSLWHLLARCSTAKAHLSADGL
jgi:hypothetical protein